MVLLLDWNFEDLFTKRPQEECLKGAKGENGAQSAKSEKGVKGGNRRPLRQREFLASTPHMARLTCDRPGKGNYGTCIHFETVACATRRIGRRDVAKNPAPPPQVMLPHNRITDSGSFGQSITFGQNGDRHLISNRPA